MSNSSWSALLTAYLPQPAADLTSGGKNYTLVIPGAADPAIAPGGFGFGTVSVSIRRHQIQCDAGRRQHRQRRQRGGRFGPVAAEPLADGQRRQGTGLGLAELPDQRGERGGGRPGELGEGIGNARLIRTASCSAADCR